MGLFFLLGFLSSVSILNKLEVIKHFGALKGSLQIQIYERQLKDDKVKHHFCFLTWRKLLLIAFVLSFIFFHLFSVQTHHISLPSMSDFHLRISDRMRVSYLHAMECFPSMLCWLIGFWLNPADTQSSVCLFYLGLALVYQMCWSRIRV